MAPIFSPESRSFGPPCPRCRMRGMRRVPVRTNSGGTERGFACQNVMCSDSAWTLADVIRPLMGLEAIRSL
jgi:hypothetical protein